jgi:hypothetical protein
VKLFLRLLNFIRSVFTRNKDSKEEPGVRKNDPYIYD